MSAPVITNTRKKRPIRLKASQRRVLEAYTFMAPMVVGIAAFFIFPLYLSLRLAFGDMVRMTGPVIRWAGLANFQRAFLEDIDFLPRLWSSARMALFNLPLIIVFSLIIAILINKKVKFRGFFRTVFFLPFLIGNGYVLAQLMRQGVDGEILQSTGVFSAVTYIQTLMPAAIGDIVNSVMGLIVGLLWGSGVQILLFLAGLQGISDTIYEAARMDNASEWDCFWHITLPMISPVILLNMVYTLVDQFTHVRNAMVVTIRNYMFDSFQFEYAAAMGWIYFIFILIFVGLIFLVMRRFIYTTDAQGGRVKV